VLSAHRRHPRKNRLIVSEGHTHHDPPSAAKTGDHIGGPAHIRVPMEGTSKVNQAISIREGQLPYGSYVGTPLCNPPPKGLTGLTSSSTKPNAIGVSLRRFIRKAFKLNAVDFSANLPPPVGTNHRWKPDGSLRCEGICTGQHHDVIVLKRPHWVEPKPATRTLNY